MSKAYVHRIEQEICYEICTSCVKQENMNNNNMEKWALRAMYQKPCLLFPMHLLNIIKSILAAL